jgi:excinuclease UvrABC ATPase subunit
MAETISARDRISVVSASTHNLKGVSVDIPKHSVAVFTGVSGSGKSSLVFDTIYTEAQRQLIDTFSSFARKWLPKLSRPPVEEIRNLSTAIVIDQKRMGVNSRSTVGTATELSTYLRLLFSRCGAPFIGPSFFFSFNHPEGMCPVCHGIGRRVQVDTRLLLDRTKSIREGAIDHPEYKVGGWNWRELTAIDLFDPDLPIERWDKTDVDTLLFTDPIPITRPHGAAVYARNFEGVARRLERLHLQKGEAIDPLKANAYTRYFVDSECPDCGGTRICERARSVSLNGRNIGQLSAMELTDLAAFLESVNGELAEPLVAKMNAILANLIHIGVGYLSIDRPVATLSGGESQRVKMARQLDCDLVDLMYILDEPTIGLHPRDIEKVTDLLRQLRDRGNSVLVVEHDPAVIRSADWIVDMGPAAGVDGGQVLFSGPPTLFRDQETPTAREVFGAPKVTTRVRRPWSRSYPIRSATVHNLKELSVDIPMEVFTCITGVAGSGKSSLIHDVFCAEHPEAIVVDQSPVGRSSRSTPATYIGVFDAVRKAFASESGVKPAMFSFNSAGACAKCNGLGYLKFEMHFLDDVTMTCDECQGKRYTEEVLSHHYRNKSISDVLEMSIEEAVGFFDVPTVSTKLRTLCDVGLGYLGLGQPLSTLSGGEAQRIKLAAELHKDGSLYVMDEPTTGLHPADIHKLVTIIDRLVDHGSTVVVIEHNLDVIRASDWVIDLGPEGGVAGGAVVAQGTPEEVAQAAGSHTARFL